MEIRKAFGDNLPYFSKPLYTIIINIIQSNFNGSNTLGTMKICSRQGQLELMSVNHSAKSGGIIGLYF